MSKESTIQSKELPKQKFLIDARFEIPAFGGLAMPAGVCFHSFKTFTLTESKSGAGITEKQALAAARRHGAGENGLTITSVCPLPEKW